MRTLPHYRTDVPPEKPVKPERDPRFASEGIPAGPIDMPIQFEGRTIPAEQLRRHHLIPELRKLGITAPVDAGKDVWLDAYREHLEAKRDEQMKGVPGYRPRILKIT